MVIATLGIWRYDWRYDFGSMMLSALRLASEQLKAFQFCGLCLVVFQEKVVVGFKRSPAVCASPAVVVQLSE